MTAEAIEKLEQIIRVAEANSSADPDPVDAGAWATHAKWAGEALAALRQPPAQTPGEEEIALLIHRELGGLSWAMIGKDGQSRYRQCAKAVLTRLSLPSEQQR